ncbi:putative leader peptide [Nakamurella sp. GG22]
MTTAETTATLAAARRRVRLNHRRRHVDLQRVASALCCS